MTTTAPGSAGPMTETAHVRVAIVGTGFAGLGLAMRLLTSGSRDFVLFEKADDLGGTWRDNPYPGCQCDVPSHLYSFSFAPNPNWTRTYSRRDEIWSYLRDCAHRFGVLPRIRFSHEVLGARWCDDEQRWDIQTSAGRWTADVLVTGHGGLSEPSIPAIPGLERFTGTMFHSAHWDPDHDVTGERVAVIGTGASAIQIVPSIQPSVASLQVYQRTPPWVLPHTDRPTTALERWLYRRVPAAQRAVRALTYWLRELTFLAFARSSWLTRRVREIGRKHLREQVPDPQLRAKLTPDYEPGCKRLLPSNHYYPAVSTDNVELVTEFIREVTETGIVTGDGQARDVDTIVLATGFRVTNHPVLELVHGRDGRSLAEVWAETGMRAYLGTTVPGFPNLFMMTGPNTGLGHTSIVFMIESQIAYVMDALAQMRARRLASVEVRPDVSDAYNDELHAKMASTVWATGGCASWYLDEHGRNTTLWPDFTWRYRLRTRRFDASSYHLAPAAGDRNRRLEAAG